MNDGCTIMYYVVKQWFGEPQEMILSANIRVAQILDTVIFRKKYKIRFMPCTYKNERT